MALIICSECGKEFSNKAKACPNCGCPTEYVESVLKTSSEEIETTRFNPSEEEFVQEKYVNEKKQFTVLTYKELLDFTFFSILPYIKKELNDSMVEVKRGNGSKEDVHFYLICNSKVIGVKVVIDAYPDVYNVGRLFGDNKDNAILAHKMNEQGVEFAIAQIGIGATDPVRFARRIFLKNDGYYFNYRELHYVKANNGGDNIRYSLSEPEVDYSWKVIAGFDYVKPVKKNPNEGILLQKEKECHQDYAAIAANRKFWKNELAATSAINKMFEESYIDSNEPEILNQLIRMVAHVTWDEISLEDAFYYVCNAIDFLRGRFLLDSEPVVKEKMLIVLKELIENNKMIGDYNISTWKITAINYIIFLFMVDRALFFECVNGYYAAVNPDDRPFDVITHKMKKAFLENPTLFGYGKDVVDEIKRIQSINSPQNLSKFETKKREIEKEMQQYCILHEKVVNKKTLCLMGEEQANTLRTFSSHVYELMQYKEKAFDSSLSEMYKVPMEKFMKIVAAYYKCIGIDEVIIERQRRGKYSMFERIDDTKESKVRYKRFVQTMRA